MASYTCTCGVRYRLPDDAGGKRARCKKCGTVFTVPKEPATIPLAPVALQPQEPLSGSAGVPLGFKESPADSTALPEREPNLGTAEAVARGRQLASDPRPQHGFWADVGWSFLLFVDPGNLFTVIILAFAYAITPLLAVACLAGIRLAIFGLLGLAVVYGWICSFYFGVISAAAAGEDGLPRIGATDGVLDDIIRPLCGFIGATFVAASPVIACAIVARVYDWPFDFAAPGPLQLVSMGAAMMAWPIVLLVVALGGFDSLLRPDLLLTTIGQTFAPYLAVCLLVGATVVLHAYSSALVRAMLGPQGSLLATFALTPLLQAYFGVVSMRIIGLYYHHFKNRFAWSWG